MKYIKDYRDGDRIGGIYLCKQKQSLVTKNGKPYEALVLQDKTGTVDGKIWDVGSPGIAEYDALDYIEIGGDVTTFNNMPQFHIKRLRVAKEGEFDPADYLPMTKKNIDEMMRDLLHIMETIENPWCKRSRIISSIFFFVMGR